MPDPFLWRKEIAARAAGLTDRLQGRFAYAGDPQGIAPLRLERWREIVSPGNATGFSRRLEYLGLDENSALAMLGPCEWSADLTLPEWVQILEEVLGFENSPHHDRCLDVDNPQPFEELLIPFVKWARTQLAHSENQNLAYASESALIDLERSLLKALSEQAAYTFWLDFNRFKVGKGRFFLPGLSQNKSSLSNELYREYVQRGLQPVFSEYPALARLLVTKTLQWRESNGEFLQNLQKDLMQIQLIFGETGNQLMGIQRDLSDPHHHGRTVFALQFYSGLKLVYKPHDLSAELAFNNLADWCNRQGLEIPLQTLKVLNRESHGWVEFVEAGNPENREAENRYYRRCGYLLGLLYLLRGSDFHYQNLIRSGEHPVAVDHEGLMRPEVAVPGSNEGEFLVAEFGKTVLRTGFLPSSDQGRDGADVSALGGQGYTQPHTRWCNINTDNIEPLKEPATTNSYQFGDIQIINLLDGFAEIYRLLLAHRAFLLSEESPLTAFKNIPVRFILRNTELYGRVLRTARDPKHLRDGLDRSLQLEHMARGFIQSEVPFESWGILENELAALERMDIPHFTAHSNSANLELENGQKIDGYFTRPAFELAKEQFLAWADADLEQQLEYIRASFYARKLSTQNDTTSEKVEFTEYEPLAANEAIEAALRIGLALEKRAIRAGDKAMWLYLGYDPRLNNYRLNPLDYNYYAGVGGVSLFLSALWAETGEKRFRELGLAALKPLRAGLRETGVSDQVVKVQGFGGAIGIGSLIYSLAKSAHFLDEPHLLEEACNLAEFNPALAETDEKLDVIGGLAGTILGLLALYKEIKLEKLLEKAIVCGNTLLKKRFETKSGYRAWVTVGGKAACGFSHGAAGISFALLQLYGVTRVTSFREAANEAILYENSQFNPETGNWSHYSSTEELPVFWTTWCHGAPGIGLGRVGGLGQLDTPEIHENIKQALETTKNFGLQNLDHLCCGNFGRLDLYVYASETLNEPDYLKLARQQATALINRAGDRGGFRLFPDTAGDLFSPGFFQGSSGIGYQLLRLASPRKYPSALLWQ